MDGASLIGGGGLAALTLAAIGAAWTPGPNNLLLASSGATFGLRRTLPHALGVGLGFPVMFFIVALFMGQLFQASPALREILKWGGAALMLWLAWRVASSGRAAASGGAARPFTFLEAAAFQWVNPKAWTMSIAISSIYLTGDAPALEAAAAAAVFAVVGLGSSHTWAGVGAALQRFLASDLRLRVFNGVMGALIAVYVAMMVSAG